MDVNETLSSYSDWCYGIAVGAYVVAMLFYLYEQAFGYRERRAAKELVAVGAGDTLVAEPADDSDGFDDSDDPDSRSRTARAVRIGKLAVSLTTFGALLHFGSLVLRALATSRAPWGNMYEFGATLCLVAVGTWLVVLRKYPTVRHLGVWVLLPVIVLMFLGGVVLYTTAAPVQPALQSYWLVIHVFAIALGSGMVLVPGVVSVLYLLKVRKPEWATRLPAADVLDQVAYRTTVFAFPIYTAGVIFGAIWAEQSWGRFWGWDPKETVAFIAWVVYAAYLHSRATAGWRGGRAAVINVVGFAAMIFNLFFINLVTAGLHSYAGV
ncbi:c-type cytochrome biogenesis protein CcsB [Actinophytocola algeriensis]|uniref:Cytochrome c-type biogenesis protein CcsB n=1 Tax=Actinophytocola algeriensis TaxID=1768010 RepID=A0A7W7QE47_9PSEU|nr:c-type cytochrome biogenesis protein CcsB [Actinophytocola algeriensis]MBB4911844.1 cytochrome c-type biogenesis protein CcsB [Actinophytocola algeriensis]MBE1477664.1 cytochrome c-type biogenesis protein CcsB [Actinophytocola algeriensis]